MVVVLLAALYIVVISFAGYLVAVFLWVKLRLTDWLGYFAVIGTSVVVSFRLFEISVWAGVLGIPAALLTGATLARRAARVFRDQPDTVFTGLFTVGRPPERVRDWPSRGTAPR